MSTIDKGREPVDSSSSYPASASNQNATSAVRTRNGSTADSLSGVIGINGGSDWGTGEDYVVFVRCNLITNEWFINDVLQGKLG